MQYKQITVNEFLSFTNRSAIDFKKQGFRSHGLVNQDDDMYRITIDIAKKDYYNLDAFIKSTFDVREL